jgi:hypothetical protein
LPKNRSHYHKKLAKYLSYYHKRLPKSTSLPRCITTIQLYGTKHAIKSHILLSKSNQTSLTRSGGRNIPGTHDGEDEQLVEGHGERGVCDPRAGGKELLVDKHFKCGVLASLAWL